LGSLLFLLVTGLFSFRAEHVPQVCLDRKAGFDGLLPSIGCYFGPIKVQLTPPDQCGFLALFDNGFEKVLLAMPTPMERVPESRARKCERKVMVTVCFVMVLCVA